MDQLLHIDLFGRTYTFKTDAVGSQAEAVAASLAGEVGRIAARSDCTGERSKLTVMMLAALNFANENYELKSDREALQHRLNRRTTRLIRALDDALAGPADSPARDGGKGCGACAIS